MIINGNFRNDEGYLDWGTYGNCPLLATAPHRFACLDHGIVKLNEPLTGEIAKGFARSIDASWCVQRNPIPVTKAMKRYLKDIPTRFWVVDFHGMRDDFGFDVCLGLGPYVNQEVANWALEIKELCRQSDIDVSINNPFPGCSSHAITRMAQERQMRAIQVELSRAMRSKGNLCLAIFLEIMQKTCPAF